MKRRTLLTGGAVAASIASFPTPALSQKRKELRMVTSWPKNFPGLGTAAQLYADQIKVISGGRYNIKLFAGGELVHPLKCHDAVQEGTADMYHSSEYYYQGKQRGYAFFSSVPFGFRADELDAWVHHGGGQAIWDEIGRQFGIVPLLCGNSGSQMGGWFKKPIRSIDDFKGLKMRMPGLGGDVLKELGGIPVTLAGSEIMPALEAGTIDAAEWVGPWNDLAFGFHKIVKNYHYPGFHEPGTAFCIGLSAKVWDAMSNADQHMFRAAAHALNNYSLAEFNANNSDALGQLINKHGVRVYEFSDEIFNAMGNAAREVLASIGTSDPLTKKVYTSFMKFRENVIGWSALSDQAYMQKRARTPFIK